MKLVLVIPPCGFCWDRDATAEMDHDLGLRSELVPGLLRQDRRAGH